MKTKYLFIILAIFLSSINMYSQQLNKKMKIESLQESNKINPEADKAYILVHSEVPNLRFDSNRRIDKVNKINSGDWEVWLPAGTHILKIYADGFIGIEMPPTNFGRKKSYEMNIKAIGYGASINADENLVEIIFSCNEDSIYSSYGEFAPTLSVSNIISYKLPAGEYNFTFQKKGYEDIKKTVDVKESGSYEISLKQGESSQISMMLPGIVMVTSNPVGAEILVNGQKIGNTPFQGDIVSGIHQIEIRKTLYYPEIVSITVEPGKVQTITQELKPRFGYLSIKSNVQNSTVYLDDKPIGKTPINKIEVESGNHKVRVDADLYYTFNQDLVLNDNDEKSIVAHLKPNFGYLYVTSLPEDSAIVYLDGKEVGYTPYKNDRLTSGKYLLKVTKNLFNQVEEYIVIQDEAKTEKNVVLNKNFGEITVIAKDANIYVNDKLVGKDEYVAKLSAGKYKVITSIDERYYDGKEDVYIARGDNKTIDLTPKPKMGSISVFVEPQDASNALIYIDNEFKGNAPLVSPLIIGNHIVTARVDGYLDNENNISISENNISNLRIQMLTYEGSQLQIADKWGQVKWYSLGAAAAAGIASGIFHLVAENNYDKYKSANTSNSAKDYRDKVDSYNSLANTALYVATTALSAALISWIIQSTF